MMVWQGGADLGKEPSCRNDPGIDELAEALKTLSDPNRLRMMCFLSGGERCVCDVESELGISQQLASHHLNVLRDAGFLKMRRTGTWSFYSVDRRKLKRAGDGFMRYLDHEKVRSGSIPASVTRCG
jgi:DNA-binding transcriptional ArsR family regulator